ncbi:MAG TPA: flagellar biosynthesis regulator FlaF [Candidatus Saccharimonadaceae bacterium]|nr:flagellar biosynthesis regulator FlaF [Candidatus Saccharimonadaceae bacterium]
MSSPETFPRITNIGVPSNAPRIIEPGPFIEAAELMERCQSDWDHPTRDAQLIQALRINSRLWDALRLDFLRVEHPLPEVTRRDLLVMSGFVDFRTLQVLSEPTMESLQALIDVDRNLAAVLMGWARAA